MLKLGFLDFKFFFLRMQFSLVAIFFSSLGYLFELMFSVDFNIYIMKLLEINV